MIWLQFWDAIGEELKLVQVSHVESFAEFGGKVHVTMASGAEHVIACQRSDIETVLGKVPVPANQIIILGL